MIIKPLPPGKQFDSRLGITTPWAKGMRRQGDRSKLAPNQFHTLQNVRVVGNQIISRGGQTKITTGGVLNGAIYGIFDDENG
jgi:hypothetical protein